MTSRDSLEDDVAALREKVERMAMEAGATEATLRRKDDELLAAVETLRDLEKELGDLQGTHRAVLTSVDIKDRDLVFAVEALRTRDGALKAREKELQAARKKLESLDEELEETRRTRDTLRHSVAIKDRDLALAAGDSDRLRADLARLESAGRDYRKRISELESLLDATMADVELLLASRRWRFGHAILSIPHRLRGRPRPGTVADHLRELQRRVSSHSARAKSD